MSFFDEGDEPTRSEPRTTARAAPRPSARRRRPTGGGRPPREAVQVRRAIAIGALVVIALLIALGVHSCDVSATRSALQNYSNNVSSLISQSDQTSTRLFGDLSGAAAAGSPTTVQNQIDQTLNSANSLVKQAQRMSVPGQVTTANRHLLLALRMRADGIAKIATEIQPALSPSAAQDAVNSIAQQMARFYASDVLYKDYAAPEIASAVNGAGVHFAGLNPGQFLPDVHWVLPSFVASELHVTIHGKTSGKVAPGLHGHQLNSVSVAGTTLQTGATNTIPVKPVPAFTLNFANTGNNDETNVICRVSVTGTSVSGQSVVAHTTAGQSTSCQVTLSSTPPTGTYTVVATVEKVPGETHLANNTLSFPVTFQ